MIVNRFCCVKWDWGRVCGMQTCWSSSSLSHGGQDFPQGARELVGTGQGRTAREVGADDGRWFSSFDRRQLGNGFGQRGRQVLGHSLVFGQPHGGFIDGKWRQRGSVQLIGSFATAYHDD